MRNVARLPESDRRELFRNTADKMGLNDAIVEKDFWVCFTLDYLFHRCPWKDAITFKGGTSLSKAFNLISRFSEDIDLILDWRVLGYGRDEPWGKRSNTKQDAFNKEANARAEVFLAEQFGPTIQAELSRELGCEANIYIDEKDKQTNSAPVQKITIVPRTSGALGYTMQVEEGNHYLMSQEEMENKIATLTGGRAAEETVFGTITTGASNDIEQATKLARAMITRYGMSRDFDMVAMETVQNQYLGGDTSLACSAETQAKIDQQVVALVKQQHEKALKLLTDNRAKLDELAAFLYEKETITGEEFMEILNKK